MTRQLQRDTVGKRSPARPGPRPVVARLVGVGLVLIIAGAVASHSRALVGAASQLRRLSPWWLLAAVAAEVVSYGAAAEIQRQLLAAAGVRVGRLFVVALSYASSAVSGLLPAGAAVATGYTYRRLARRGAGPGVIVWVLVASGVVSTAALAALGLSGAAFRGVGLFCSAAGWLGAGLIAAGAIGGVVMLAWASGQRSRLVAIAALVERIADWGRRLVRRGRSREGHGGTPLMGGGADAVTMGPVGWLWVCTAATLNWAADGAALGLSFFALGLVVPWHGLLLAYVVSQVAASVPVLGCVGLVETSMTLALVCAGVKADSALAVVLVYRLVTFWSVLPVGWLAWAWLRWREKPAASPARLEIALPVPEMAA
jgi:putative heme transporter